MKLFTAIASAAAVVGASFLVPNPAKAAGCYVSMAAMDMDNIVAGGGTLNQAYNYALKKGSLDGSDMCWIELKGFVRSTSTLNKYVYNAIFR